MRQSTNHLLMIKPVEFYANPETADTNAYQAGPGQPDSQIFQKALAEFEAFQGVLKAAGVRITQGHGIAGSPDMVFPNWFFTHDSGEVIFCPMNNKNRQAERTEELKQILQGLYPKTLDWTGFEADGRALESTASIVSDHVNKRAYAALSARTDEALARQWAAHRGYSIEIFETRSHAEIPVYHTDCVMWIGSSLAGICDSVIVGPGRERIVGALSETHDVVRFTAAQLRTFCGNALEVAGSAGEKMLAISEGALDSMTAAQIEQIERHFTKILSAPLSTLEQYGGGSARCMLAELF
ncbi:MAG: hypothetical protein IT559_00600 [Alphaproteobacteria bacterium]|nr:hypothetical protein [Alphaproteobacteria bacterium]